MYLFIRSTKMTTYVGDSVETVDLVGSLSRIDDLDFHTTGEVSILKSYSYMLRENYGFYKYRFKRLKER